jgi:predicted ribosomally synthesized peptide with SipW-like signal peptide
MSKLKKILLVVTVYVLVAALAVGGTLAYLTDRDSQANVFTVGDVTIDLIDAFEQGAELMPGKMIAEKPVIKNIGKNDAWVWLTFSVPSALDNYVQGTENGSNENIIHWNPTGATAEGYVNETRVNNAIAAKILPEGNTAEDILANNKTWNVFNSLGTGENVYQETIGGVAYNTYVLLYNKAIVPGETTLPSIYQVFLDAQVDIDPNGDWYRVVNGTVTPIDWNTDEDGKPVIYVGAYGIQKEGFANVQTAYAAYQAQWGENGSEYNTTASVEIPEDAVPVSDLAGLQAAIANGGNVQLTAPIQVESNLSVEQDTAIYSNNNANVMTFVNNTKVTVAADTALELYGVQMDGQGTYSFDANGNIVYDADARRTTPLLNAGAGSKLVVGTGTNIENVVAKGSAVISVSGADNNRATVILEGATIQSCAGESGTIINVNKASDVVIEEGTVISNNASYNNNNHGIIRVYNAWDAANPSTVTMNGGEINGNYYSGNGMIGLYYGKFILNGGEINNNSWFTDNQKNNGWYPVVYAHSNSQFVMNGGEITGNTVKYGVINSLNSSVEGALTINGGTITNNIATNNDNKEAFAVVISEAKNSLIVSDAANVSGTVWIYYGADGNYLGAYKELSEYLGK